MNQGVSIVTVYNNQKLYDEMIKSLEYTNVRIQLFGIDNTNNQFSSAAKAYNYSLNYLTYDIVIFCHQDIDFYEGSIEKIVELCTQDKKSIYGSAGINIGTHSEIISKMAILQKGWNYKTLKENEIKEVFTLDECLIACNKEVLKQVRFDDVNCDGWHLYTADFCMNARLHEIKSYVFDCNILHKSSGNPDKSFYMCERQLAKKYRKDYKIITYTCGWTYTDIIRYWILHIYRLIRYKIY